jgi:hypothetical protein
MSSFWLDKSKLVSIDFSRLLFGRYLVIWLTSVCMFCSLRRVDAVLIKSPYSLSLLRVCCSVEISLFKMLKMPLKILPSLRMSVMCLVSVSSFLRCRFISLSCPIILKRSSFCS